MKKLQLLSLVLIFGFISFIVPIAKAEEMNILDIDSNIVSTEYEADDIKAEDLGLTTNEIPEKSSWWNNFKDNSRLFFTFNQAKKADLELKLASKKLLIAKKLAKKGNKVEAEKVLNNYRTKMKKVGKRLENLPEEKRVKYKNALDRLNNNQLKHTQVLRKLKTNLPVEKIDELNKENAERWYKVHKEKIKERLNTAIDQNAKGSKLKHLNNLVSIQELKGFLPEEAMANIEDVENKLDIKLKKKFKELSSDEVPKLDKYLGSLRLNGEKKREVLNTLDDDEMPSYFRNKVIKLKEANLNKIEKRFKELNKEDKLKYLKRFEGKARLHKVEILDKLQANAPEDFKKKIKNINDNQINVLKEKINSLDNTERFNKWEQKLKKRPILLRELKNKRNSIKHNPNLKTQ